MKLLILGATGRTGKQLLEEALKRGHKVRMLARDPGKTNIRNENLEIMAGSPYNAEAFKGIMEGVDVVYSCLNVKRKTDNPWARLVSPGDLMSKSISNAITEMKAAGVSRIIVISAAGAGDSARMTPGWFRWIIRNSNIRYAYEDHDRQEELLQSSGLDWTALRPTGLTNRDNGKKIVVTYGREPRPGFSISRLAVARFMLDIADVTDYFEKAPVISQR